jgi:recombination protein RecT
MYARKIPLLQVLKYMPQSIELSAALEAAHAAEEGRNVTIDADTWVPTVQPGADDTSEGDDGGGDQQQRGDDAKPVLSAEDFAKKAEGWKKAIAGGKAVNDVIATAETKNTLTATRRWRSPRGP